MLQKLKCLIGKHNFNINEEESLSSNITSRKCADCSKYLLVNYNLNQQMVLNEKDHAEFKLELNVMMDMIGKLYHN